MSLNRIYETYDVVIAGGGLSGVCAAIAAARHGVRTAIVQNRPMFGGNASSECRVNITSASCYNAKDNLEETGILREILLENKRRNRLGSFSVFDSVIWEKVRFQDGLTSYLNTNVDDIVMDGDRISEIVCHQSTTETEIRLKAKIFVDATGHGTVGVMAGAANRKGSEGRSEFNEPTAPDEPNSYTMGDTLVFTARDRGEPVEFVKPFWARTFTEDDLKFRPHEVSSGSQADGGIVQNDNYDKDQLPIFTSVDEGYWWIELGGDYDDLIRQSEQIRDDLMACVYGIWDHMKNGGDHGCENLSLDWVGIVPGHRESRRLEGDYILNEVDVRANRVFHDAVAYGGWSMDEHVPGGINSTDTWANEIWNFKGCYSIPYRCYYSRNVPNLMMAGRNISASKLAFGSTRIMGTCAVGGQAVGTACALAIKYDCLPREVGTGHIEELQQELLKDGCYIPGFKNTDEADLARKAHISASSEKEGCEAMNVINGISRTDESGSNCWESTALGDAGASLELRWDTTQTLSTVILMLDSDLNKHIMPSLTRQIMEREWKYMPPQLLKDYSIKLFHKGDCVAEQVVQGNYQCLNTLHFDAVTCDRMEITVSTTHGWETARIFEVRAYA